MTTTEREACFACGEPVSLEALVCPYCDRSVLADVVLEAPLGDSRLRYQLARSLTALGVPLGSFLEVQKALAAPRPAVARHLTRAQAARVLETLEAAGVAAVLRASQRSAASGRSLPAVRDLLNVAALVALVAAAWGWFVWMRPAARPEARPTAATAAATSTGAASPESRGRATLTSQELARRAVPSTILLRCARSLGAGFFVTDELLLTNAHVLCPSGERPRIVFADGRELAGDVMRSDERLDMALVRVAGAAAQPLPLGDVGTLSVGDKVVLVGNPRGLDSTFHEGSVSNLSRAVLGVAYVQVEAEIEPGNSGGPLIDVHGRVVGIVSLKQTQAERIGFALPINYAFTGDAPFVSAPEGLAASDAFGVMLAKAQSEDRQAAQQISSIDVRPGIVGARVDEYRRLVVKLARLARTMPPGAEVSVNVWRGGEIVCSLKGDVSEWTAIENRMVPQSEPRLRAWLDHVGFDYYLYVGESPLRWDLCPREKMTRGIELELEDGNSQAPRLALR
jgi:serine protease Do